MVEGPGCLLKGEKLRVRSRGQVVNGVSGNAVANRVKKKKSTVECLCVPPMSPFHIFLHHTACDVQTIGKELFMFFEGLDVCLRVHFLMSGGFCVNGEPLAGDGGDEPTLVLHMSRDKICFTKSSVLIRSVTDVMDRIKNFKTLDICNSAFSHQKAVETLQATGGERQVCDVLLDQDLLPGVGNIIKNEALFDSGIRPNTKMRHLTSPHISFLVKMTRDFSMLFYKCRKKNKALEPYLKIYRKVDCKQCGSKVTTTRMGEESRRLTSYCSACQSNDLMKLPKTTLPSKNSLLGWMRTGLPAAAASLDWSCDKCTLSNKSPRTRCEACLTPRLEQKTHQQNVAGTPELENNPITADVLGGKWRCIQCTLINDIKNTVCSACLSPDAHRTEPGKQNYQLASNLSQTVGVANRTGKTVTQKQCTEKTPPLISSSETACPMDIKPKCLKTESADSTQKSVGRNKRKMKQQFPLDDSPNKRVKSDVAATEGPGDQTVAPPVGVRCSHHKAMCIMREVRKNNENKQRMFYSCPVRTCSFFMWADERFPQCEAHGKPCVLRTVLKEGANNGRRFFACSRPTKKQCQYFQWADQYNTLIIR